MLLCLMLFADFTFSAPMGTWLDYARSGVLSENRFLVVQQNGEKGDYHLGANQIVLNEYGAVLYEIPVAENAWIILNGILASEDTYLFQNRGESHFNLWHPDFGVKKIAFIPEGQREIIPGTMGSLNKFLIGKHGDKLFFVSEQASKGKPVKYHTVIEILEFHGGSIAALFSDQFQPRSYASTRLEHLYDVNLFEDKMILCLPHKLQKAYLELKYTDIVDGTFPFKERQASRRHLGFTYEDGLLTYLSWNDNSSKLVLEIEGANKPLFVSSSQNSDRFGYDVLLEFAQTVGHGSLHRENSVYSYQEGDVLTTLDINTGWVRRYQLSEYVAGTSAPRFDRIIEVDHQKLVVSDKLSDDLEKPSKLIFEMNLNSDSGRRPEKPSVEAFER